MPRIATVYQGMLTSLSRVYLISYFRMSPLGFFGSSHLRRTLFLLAGSQVMLPGILSARAGKDREQRQEVEGTMATVRENNKLLSKDSQVISQTIPIYSNW